MTTTAAPAQFDIGRVIERTFKAIGGNFATFLILSLLLRAAPALAFNVIQFGATGALPGRTMPATGGVYKPEMLLLTLLGGLVTLATSYLVQGALIRGTFAQLSGKRATLGELLSTGVRFILPLFGLSIVMGIALGLGFILFIVPGLFLMTMWIVAAPAVVVDRKGVFESLGRSAELTRGSRWPIFGLMVIFWICAWVAGMVGSSVLFGSFLGGQPDPTLMAVGLVVSAVVSALVSMVGAVGVASIYYELRSMKDGLGVEQLASVFD
jgi:hypothetical protein